MGMCVSGQPFPNDGQVQEYDSPTPSPRLEQSFTVEVILQTPLKDQTEDTFCGA